MVYIQILKIMKIQIQNHCLSKTFLLGGTQIVCDVLLV